MSSLLNGITTILNPTPATPASTGVTVNVGATVGTSSGSSSTPSTGTQPTTPSNPSTPSTPSNTAPVQDSRDKRAFAMTVGQTVYVNLYASFAGINPWQAYTVGWVFGDGNAILVSEPNNAVYTGGLMVGANLRRANETYANPAPGP